MTAITLRPVTPQDRDFLYRVYASTRHEELAPLGWDEAQMNQFLESQFTAQDKYYREHLSGTEFQVILADGRPVGRLYVDRREDEIRIVDIALLSEHRRAGIGGHLLKDILAEAGAAGLPVRIHVEKTNPALGLYRRLGFREVEDKGVYHLMEWRPELS